MVSLVTALALVASSLQPTGGSPQAHGMQVSSADTALIPVAAGWNLLSVPLIVQDPRTTVLFPSATSYAFTYHQGYVRSDTLRPGVGYWLKFAVPETVMITGEDLNTDTISLVRRWNLIGSLSMSIAASKFTTEPPSDIVSGYYAYYPDSGYRERTVIEPGRGYWGKAEVDGILIATLWEYLGLGYKDITALAPVDSNTVYAAARGAIFRTTSGGQSWDTLFLGIRFTDVVVHPVDRQVVYAGIGGYTEPPYGILKTTDAGVTWDFKNSGLDVDWEHYIGFIQFDPIHPETLYTNTYGPMSGHLYKTTNGGSNWYPIDDSISADVVSIVIDPEATTTIWAAGSYISKSTDGGMTWTRLVGTQPSLGILSLARDKLSGTHFYAGVTVPDGAFQESTDGGSNWTISNSGLLPNSSSGHITVDSLHRVVFIGNGATNNDGGVFYRRGDETLWHQMDLTRQNFVTCLAVSADYRYLYVGLNDWQAIQKLGLYRMAIH